MTRTVVVGGLPDIPCSDMLVFIYIFSGRFCFGSYRRMVGFRLSFHRLKYQVPTNQSQTHALCPKSSQGISRVWFQQTNFAYLNLKKLQRLRNQWGLSSQVRQGGCFRVLGPYGLFYLHGGNQSTELNSRHKTIWLFRKGFTGWSAGCRSRLLWRISSRGKGTFLFEKPINGVIIQKTWIFTNSNPTRKGCLLQTSSITLFSFCIYFIYPSCMFAIFNFFSATIS